MGVLVGLPEKVFEGQGGAYYSWTSAKMPVLGTSKVGACKIVLQNRGFAFPHYADSSKIAFVLQGCGDAMAGLISPDSKKETVVRLKKGDSFTVKKGVVSWWYNPGDSLLEIVFLGETSDAILPGEFTYLFISGTNGLLNSFSPEFISKLYNMTEEEASRLATSQAGMIAVKLQENVGPEPTLPRKDCFNFGEESESPELHVSGGGVSIKRFTSGEDDKVKVGPDGGDELCAFEIKLEAKGGLPPMYMARSAAQVFYVVKGKVWVQIVSGNGGIELDQHVEPGYLFVVPKFYMVAMVAGDQGSECLSVVTTSKPVLGELGNVWSAMSGGVLEAALRLNPKDVGVYNSKINKVLMISPPPQ